MNSQFELLEYYKEEAEKLKENGGNSRDQFQDASKNPGESSLRRY